MSLGSAVFVGDSKLFEGPLGVVQVGFNGFDLGKTTADTILTPDQDIKDINYQQDGSKAADHVRTGIDYLLAVTFGEISTGLLDLLMSGISTSQTLATEDSGIIDRVMYESMRDVEAGGLKIASVNVNGVPSENLENIMNFYEVIPIINGDLVNWGADTQRNLAMQFRIKWHEYTAAELAALVVHTARGSFGYWGDPTDEDVPPIDAYFVTGPIIASAVVQNATDIDVTFNKDIAYQTAHAVGQIVISQDGVWLLSDSDGGIVSEVLTVKTVGMAGGEIIRVSISSICIEDTEATANAFPGVYGRVCVNEL